MLVSQKIIEIVHFFNCFSYFEKNQTAITIKKFKNLKKSN